MIEHGLKGVVIGFAVAAPVGPIAILILRRSLTDGRLAAFVSGLGAAAADALCGVVAALALAAVKSFLEAHSPMLHLVGGGVTVLLGVHTLYSTPPARPANRPLHERSLIVAFVSTCLLTLANPLTLFGMVFVVAATGVNSGAAAHSVAETTALVTGIFLGSTMWWLILTTCAAWLGQHLGPRLMRSINIVAALLIIGFGLWQLSSFARDWL